MRLATEIVSGGPPLVTQIVNGQQTGERGLSAGSARALTCPECGGALKPEALGHLLPFRCHIGHTLVADTLLAAHFSILEGKLEPASWRSMSVPNYCRILGEVPAREPLGAPRGTKRGAGAWRF